MSQLMRPLRPKLTNLLALTLFSSAAATITTSAPLTTRHRARGLRLPNSSAPLQPTQNNNENDSSLSDNKRSRNQQKREAKRSVKWAMDLASFSNPQIKRILKAVSLEEDVFDAILLVKRLGPDVREGKRRQYNYIGKLLREVQPELMDGLIQAAKDGDHSMLGALSASASIDIGDEDDDEEFDDATDEEESIPEHFSMANRWFEGLISKDIPITNEVYSVHSVDFDRQELRRLVRNVHVMQEPQDSDAMFEGEIDVALDKAKKSLTRFLRSLAEKYTKSII